MQELEIGNLAGVGPVTVKKLSESGIDNIMDLIVRGPVEVAEITGMEKDSAERIVTKARMHMVETGLINKDFTKASELYEYRKTIGKISTGTESLDKLFDGGVETQALTEIYGEFGCGKTQFAHTLSVQVQLPIDQGGLEGNVIYIDTENTFRPERIVAIAQAKGLDPETVLDNIQVARAYNSSHQMLILEECGRIIKENNIKLIIADSAVGLFRSEYLGRGTLAGRQQKLNQFVHTLVRIAETYNIAAIATNQVMADPGVMFGDPTRAIGGNVVAHTSTYRIYLRKSGKKRVARMIDSPHHPEAEAVFALGNAGVMDIETAEKEKKEIEKAEKAKARAEKKSSDIPTDE